MPWLTEITTWIPTGERNSIAYDWVKVEGLDYLTYPIFQQRRHIATETIHEARALADSVPLPDAEITETRDSSLRLTSTTTILYARTRANDAGACTIRRITTLQTTTYLSRFKWDPEGNLNEGVSPPSG